MSGFLAGLSLETLVAPFDVTEFTETYWDRTPLPLLRGLPNFYDGLTTINEIDAAVASGLAQIALMDAGSENHSYTEVKRRDATHPDTDNLLAKMSEGATLVMDRAELALTGPGRMCRLLMLETGHPWHCAVHATSPKGQGMPAKVNESGMFILQLTGSREWSFDSTQLCRPIAGEHGIIPPIDWQDAAETVQLTEGDMLYVPRGVAFAAKATECDGSLHIALTIAEYSWAQVGSLLAAAIPKPDETDPPSTSSPHRDLLPLGFHLDEIGLAQALNERFPGDSKSMLDAFLTAQVDQFQPDRSGRFIVALNDEPISLDSKLRRRDDVLWRFTDVGDRRDLICGPIRLAFTARAEIFVQKLMRHRGRLNEIESDLSEPERLTIATALLRRNLIRRA